MTRKGFLNRCARSASSCTGKQCSLLRRAVLSGLFIAAQFAAAQSGLGIATPASASPSPVAGTSTLLSVLGSDSAGEATLTYTWSANGPAPVTFTGNATNASKGTTALFQNAGDYNINVLISDGAGNTANSSVNITVNQTESAVTISPGPVSINVQGTQQFSAIISDQFGNPMTPPSGTPGWNTLPGTLLQNVCPPDNFGGQNYAFNFNCPSVIRAWNSAIVDPLRNRMIIWGGGHTNYLGNEIYSLNLNDSPATLTRLNDPSPINPNMANCVSALADGNPNSRETFNSLVYMEHVDRMYVFGGSLACGSGDSDSDTWTLDLGTLEWKQMDPANGFSTPSSFNGSVIPVAAYETATRTVLLVWLDRLWRYTYETNTYELLSSNAHAPYGATGALDTKRNLFVFMGHDYQQTAPRIFVMDVSGNTPYVSQEWTSQVSGCDALASASYPGLVYDPVLDRIVGWPNTGSIVYLFNPDTKTCTTQFFSNGPTRPPRVADSGTFGRFNYFPTLGTYVLVNDSDENAYTLRMTSNPTGFAWFVDGGGSITQSGLFTAGNTPGGPFNVSARIGSAGGTVPVTITGSGIVPAKHLALNLDSVEVSGKTNGSAVTPAMAPAGFTGSVVVNGGGSVNFAPVQSGNGVYFLNCCSNTNNSYYKFTGAMVGSIFNVSQGQISFYLQSRYSFAQRQGILPRFAFDVRDNDPTNHVFGFETQVASGQLVFGYTVAGIAYNYYVPAGTEDSLFGNGITVKVTIGWDAALVKLSLNDNLVQVSPDSHGVSNWTAASNFDLGAYEYLTYGGYYTSDDVIAGFTVTGPPIASDTIPPAVSVTAPLNGANVSGTVALSANATDAVGMANLQFVLDGANLGMLLAGAGPAYGISWNTTGVANGSHVLEAVATDISGNSATSASVSVTVSNTVVPPTVSITAPSSGASLTGTVTVSANATDKVGVTQVQFQLNGANLGSPMTGAGPSYGLSWNTTMTRNGTHILTAIATDAAGNSATSSGVTVTVNNSTAPPVISAVSAASIGYSSATIRWTTNQASTSQVAYGTTSSYGSTTTLSTTLVTSHTVNLAGLEAATIYHFQVLSQTASGGLSSSGDFTFTTATTAAGRLEPSQVLIVYKINGADNNHNGLSDSFELAQYYALRRNVPLSNLVGLTTSVGSSYSLGQYGTFYSEIVAPIQSALTSLGSTNIDVILLAGELPTVVYDGSKTALSIDNALMGINALGSASNTVITKGANPYFDPAPGFDTSPGHFNHTVYQYNGTTMYLVSHLGSDSSLRGIDQVDQSLYADLFVYPQPGYYYGNAYVDSQSGIPYPLPNYGFPYTDAFLSAQPAVQQGLYDNSTDADMNVAYAEHYVLASGFPLKWESTTTNLSIGDPGATFSDGTSALTAPRALFYGGWYNFNKYNNVYQWLPGSVAADLNSAPYFAMQALDHGASAASYAVSEPFLDGGPQPNILYYYFAQRLLLRREPPR